MLKLNCFHNFECETFTNLVNEGSQVSLSHYHLQELQRLLSEEKHIIAQSHSEWADVNWVSHVAGRGIVNTYSVKKLKNTWPLLVHIYICYNTYHSRCLS